MRNQKYEAFLEAARTGSFKQAASELGYTQAGVSYLANALEKELGVRLFVREHGGVRLTSEGAALLPWVQEVCASERRLETHLADLKQLEEGSLHIVAFTSTLTQWLPQITKRFTEAHPHIDLRITCCDDQAQLEHIVESGQADVFKKYSALKRNGKPEEIAALFALLLDERLGFLTGADILMDGGVVASGASGLSK